MSNSFDNQKDVIAKYSIHFSNIQNLEAEIVWKKVKIDSIRPIANGRKDYN